MVEVSGLADTGAQMCVGGMDFLDKLGVCEEELVVPELWIAVADNAGLQVVGAIFARIMGAGGVCTSQMVYMARGIGMSS